MAKQRKTDILERGNYNFEGTLDSVIGMLQEIREKWTKSPFYKAYTEFEISSIPREYEEGYELAIVGKRLETDEEEAFREKANAKYKENRRQLYEDLKKEFAT